MYLKLDDSKWYRHSYEWEDWSKRKGRCDVYKGQIEVAEDVAPVVHAYNKSKDGFLCSACTFGDFGQFNHGGKYTPKYCPQCGAKMDKVTE